MTLEDDRREVSCLLRAHACAAVASELAELRNAKKTGPSNLLPRWHVIMLALGREWASCDHSTRPAGLLALGGVRLKLGSTVQLPLTRATSTWSVFEGLENRHFGD